MSTESKATQTPELEITDQFLDEDCSEEKRLDEINKVMGNFRYAGFFLGFVIQLVSLGAVTWIGLQWDEGPALHQTVSEKVVYTLLWVLSHTVLVIWPVVWMGPFLLSLTDRGARVVGPLFPSDAASDRDMFLTGVHFFVGISTGSFLAMGLTDAIVGFPVPMFKLMISLLICLLLCKTMVVFYDSEELRLAAQTEQEEEEQALIGGAEMGSSPYKLLTPAVV